MAEDDEKAKKLAAQIRASTESDEFDLQGFGAEQCEKLAAAAFAKALPISEMVRLSFVVCGGKKVRQKYADALPAMWADALKKVGFSEDRGASLDKSCQGLFKFQHNTDTDLKVTHVYPKLDPEAAAVDISEGGSEQRALTPIDLITFAELPTFERMIAAKCPSLAQRRKALEVIKEARAGLKASEEKLVKGEQLTDEEQHRYDTLEDEGLEKKQSYLSKLLEGMIDKGQLTNGEKDAVLEQLASKVEQLEVQIASAESEGKAKRVEKLQTMLSELRVRVGTVRDAKPIKRSVKFEKEIAAAQKKLADLEKLENSKVVLPLSEVQKLAAKPKLLEDLKAMQTESRGWFSPE